MIPLVAWPAAAFVGLSLGMVGSGGSILTVPLLAAVLGLPEKVAVASSLPIVGLIALAGAAVHARRGAVALASAWPFTAASIAAAFLSRRLVEPHVPPGVQRWAFAALMLVVAWRMVRVPSRPAEPPRRRATSAVVATGVLVGVLTGVLGVGGGFLIVPALVLMLGFEVRTAIGTSLAVIALTCTSSLVADRLGSATPIRWDLVGLFSTVGIAGALLGGRFAHRVPAVALRRVFATVVVAMAGLLLWNPYGG